MQNFFVKFLTKKLDGYKTLIGAIMAILYGLSLAIIGLLEMASIAFPDLAVVDFTTMEDAIKKIQEGIIVISGAFIGGGIAHKIEKQKDKLVD